MVNFKKTTKGITMIALIITILVLLVLATVTIRIMINNGIIGTSRRGAEDYIVGQEKEAIHTGFQNYQQELELDENAVLKVEGASVTGNEEDGWDIVFNTTGHAYHLKSDGIIEGDEIIVANQPTTPSQEENTSTGGETPTPSENTTPEENTTVEEETPIPEGTPLKVGDYVDYTYDTASAYSLSKTYSGYSSNQTISQTNSLKWRILSIENNQVTLISSIPTEESVCLTGALGYNNGVYLLNDICAKLYSNKVLGITARSVNLDDIEDQMTDTGKKLRDEFTKTISQESIKYGNTYTLTGTAYINYPNIYAQEKGQGIDSNEISTTGKDRSDNIYSTPTTETSSRAKSKLTIQVTDYDFGQLKDVATVRRVFKDNTGQVIFQGSMFWVASRSIMRIGPYSAAFLLRTASGNSSSKDALYIKRLYDSSYEGSYTGECLLRPMVTVNADWIGATGGTASNPRSLTKT